MTTTTTTASTSGASDTAKPAKKAKRATKAYEGVVLVRVYSKETGECLGYAAKPTKPLDEDGSVKPWHRLVCDEVSGEWSCDCDGNAKWHRRCKHIKAVSEVCGIRAEQGRPVCKPVMAACPEMDNAPALVEEAKESVKVETHVMEVPMPGDVSGWRPVQRRLPSGEWYPMGMYGDGRPIEFHEMDHAIAFISAATDQERREVIIAAKRAEKKLRESMQAEAQPMPSKVGTERGRVTTRLTGELKKRDEVPGALNSNRDSRLVPPRPAQTPRPLDVNEDWLCGRR